MRLFPVAGLAVVLLRQMEGLQEQEAALQTVGNDVLSRPSPPG